MRRVLVISVLVLVFFLIEFILFNISGGWILPNMLLLLTVFFTLYLGIRFGILTAILAGIIQDSFATGLFGASVFSLIVCAYLSIYLRKYLYFSSVNFSRLIIIFILCIVDFINHFIMHSVFGNVDMISTFKFVFLPETVTTLFVTVITFEQLKKCVLKLSV